MRWISDPFTLCHPESDSRRHSRTEPTQQELDAEYYTWEDLRTQEDEWYERDMDWTISRDERLFNAEVRGCEYHLF